MLYFLFFVVFNVKCLFVMHFKCAHHMYATFKKYHLYQIECILVPTLMLRIYKHFMLNLVNGSLSMLKLFLSSFFANNLSHSQSLAPFFTDTFIYFWFHFFFLLFYLRSLAYVKREKKKEKLKATVKRCDVDEDDFITWNGSVWDMDLI